MFYNKNLQKNPFHLTSNEKKLCSLNELPRDSQKLFDVIASLKSASRTTCPKTKQNWIISLDYKNIFKVKKV
jgi:hypothetical protein